MTRNHIGDDTARGLGLKGPSINSISDFHKEKEMADFRKWFPVLAIVALLAVSSTANAQITCVQNAGVPPTLRAEGLTELVGDIVLICSGFQANVPVSANVQVFLNTNVTSRLVGTWAAPNGVNVGNATEALLLLNEPGVSTPSTATGNTIVQGRPSVVGVGGVTTQGSGNAFLGARVSDNAVAWLGIPFSPTGTTQTVRITNLRANASQLLPPGSTGTLVPPQVVAYISISGSQSIAVNNPQQVVGFVQTGMTFDLRGCPNSSTVPTGQLQCVSLNSSLAGDATSAPATTFLARFRENFATAFKVRVLGESAGVGSNQSMDSQPGAPYNTESGYVVPTGNFNGITAQVGLADTGTRLAVRFVNIPAGVQLFVGTSSGTASTSTVSAILVTTDANGAGGTPAVSSTGLVSSAPAGSTSTTCAGGTVGLSQVTISGGTGMAVYEITNANPFALEELLIPMAFAYRANTSNNLPGLGTASAQGSFAPFYTSPTGSTMSSSLPIPRFVDAAVSRNALTINACVTNLLFPFVTNQAGFDSGLAISNTSLDIFGTPTQAGACDINYFGIGTGGGATTKTRETSTSIPAGGQLLFTLSGASNNTGVTGNAGFQGYIIARCFFQYAHGFAFISDLGSTRLAEGYLALVMDAPIGSRTGSTSESLGN
jgi:hypothetical protein